MLIKGSFVKVWAWGDNDHGQQGNGTTCVNRRPAVVAGVEGVQRAAAGSSHSAAWALRPAALQPDIETPHVAPLPFPTLKDPLGAHSLGKVLQYDVHRSHHRERLDGVEVAVIHLL